MVGEPQIIRAKTGASFTLVSGGLLSALPLFVGSVGAQILGAISAAAVVVTVRWPLTAVAMLAVAASAGGFAAGHPTVMQACIAGVSALVYLVVVEVRCCCVHRADTAAWLVTRAVLLIGGMLGFAAAALAALPRGLVAALTVAGIAVTAVLYTLLAGVLAPERGQREGTAHPGLRSAPRSRYGGTEAR